MTNYNYKEFLFWEQLSRDTIDVKRVYIDITDDLVAGILLSQIVYWYLPNKEGKTKLRVQKDNELWLAKGRNDWWDECRITPKQFDRAIKILQKKGLVEKKIFKFDGSPTVHIKLNLDILISLISSFLPKGENRNSPKGKNEIDQKVKTLTKNTTEITTKINNNNKEEKNTSYVDKKNNTHKHKNVVVVNEEEYKKLKAKIEEITGNSVIDKKLKEYLKKPNGKKELEEAIINYPDVIEAKLNSGEDIINPVGLFFYVAENYVKPPKSKKSKKKDSFSSFEQHDYSDEDLEYLFEPIEKVIWP